MNELFKYPAQYTFDECCDRKKSHYSSCDEFLKEGVRAIGILSEEEIQTFKQNCEKQKKSSSIFDYI